MSEHAAAVPIDTGPFMNPVGRANRSLDFLPVGLFGSAMGLTGLAVAWRFALTHYPTPVWLLPVASTLDLIAIVSFVAILVGYTLKVVTAFDVARSEFRHPIAGNLFGTLLISLLLVPIILAPYSMKLAQALWLAGAVAMILFAWLMVSRWMSDRQQVAHATPAWIIPLVGLLDLPLALPVLRLPGLTALAVFAMAVGLFFAVPLFTLIFSRLLFEPPLPDALKPSLLILVAPFAVGCSAYVLTVGRLDLFAQTLYMLMLFILAVLIPQLRHLLSCCPFRVSWWAVSFPLSASAIAALRFAAAEPGWLANAIAWLLLAMASLVITGLFARTLVGLARGELRTLSS